VADAPLSRLIGTWDFELTVEGQVMAGGSTTFAWLEDGAFVVQHADATASESAPPAWVENSPFPVRAVLGTDDTTAEQVMLYADARGVYRVYRMTLTDDDWRLERAAPDFHQRFIGSFTDEGRTLEGRWEASADGTAWDLDFNVTYRRRTP
jgi:hypothetical protein